ncbi:hypothetical protein T01_13890 [Trichinella spiralis]|uniref:Uncharacterized protein n=1 Tax=Trichinella spiralis TaxID=6334 RepID=A0A0V0YRQ8_TRISP|nr:hypothetical protein T01_13890 [Trichinella spiralis]
MTIMTSAPEIASAPAASELPIGGSRLGRPRGRRPWPYI